MEVWLKRQTTCFVSTFFGSPEFKTQARKKLMMYNMDEP
jgi:hypothetical protein